MFLLARRSGHAFGLLVAEEARQNGWLPRLERAVEKGAAIAVRPGVYLSARRWRALSRADRTLARIYAVSLMHPDVVFAAHSAAALYRLPLPDDADDTVHVLRAPEGAPAITAHPESADGDVVPLFGLTATSPVQTVLDMAVLLEADDALTLLRAAIHPAPDGTLLCTRAELREAAESSGAQEVVQLTEAVGPERLSAAA